MDEHVETIVIGAGQAGLAMSWHLTQRGCEHLVLERARIAERWRTQRWDSLYFQFPNWSLELPAHPPYTGGPPDAFAHRSEVCAFLEEYAAAIRAPLRCGVEVTALRSDEKNGYKLLTPHGTLRARSVVVATGPHQRARIPSLHQGLPPGVLQVHAGDYRNPASLPDGAVVVVGSGASGCQIADELVEVGRRVHLCVGRHQRVPRRYRGRDSFWWRRELGMLDETAAEVPPERRLPPPLVTGVHGGYDVDLRQSAARGLSLLGHLQGSDGNRMYFADDLDAQLRAGDRSLDEFLARVDQHIERTGLDAPSAPERADPSPPPIDSPSQLDVRGERIGSVVWATGYDRDFSWVELPVLDSAGTPIHTRGVTAMQGLYFLGMPWLYKRKSTFLAGVGEDAGFIADAIAGTGERTQG
jgi:putative flavoprotein involved in K+ transport